jgi:hypothetical protein
LADHFTGIDPRTLVPEYSDAGEQPGEAIVLEPMDQK